MITDQNSMRVELTELKGDTGSSTVTVEDVSALLITERTSKEKVGKETEGLNHNKSTRSGRIPPNSSRHIILITPGTVFKICETRS